MNKKKSLIEIILIVLVVVLFGLLVFSLITTDQTIAEEWRESPEGKCLKEVAIKFCLERDMKFNKLYPPLYRSIWKSEDFLCDDYGLTNIYTFTRSEEEKCMGALTK